MQPSVISEPLQRVIVWRISERSACMLPRVEGRPNRSIVDQGHTVEKASCVSSNGLSTIARENQRLRDLSAMSSS